MVLLSLGSATLAALLKPRAGECPLAVSSPSELNVPDGDEGTDEWSNEFMQWLQASE